MVPSKVGWATKQEENLTYSVYRSIYFACSQFITAGVTSDGNSNFCWLKYIQDHFANPNSNFPIFAVFHVQTMRMHRQICNTYI